jgi:ADP-ribose pyrophosphatase YjhB (NUDIX family)
VDPIIIDDFGNIVLIARRKNPGAGLLALPGGFIDQVMGKAEDPMLAAIREAVKETSIDISLLLGATKTPVGHRKYDRPYDIREAWRHIPDTEIKKGDFFLVSTQGFLFNIHRDLNTVSLTAGDDAKGVGVFRIDELDPVKMGASDHLEMIQSALAMSPHGESLNEFRPS